MHAKADADLPTATYELARPLRAAIFSLAALFMIVGPFCSQVLGLRHPAIRPWKMFSSIGIGLADLQFSVRQPDGSLKPIDYYRVLGYKEPLRAPSSVRRVVRLPAVRQIARKICSVLGPDADVRAKVRIAQRSGWFTEISEADGNICRWDERL